MMRIMKYQLEVTDEQVLDLPTGAHILSVGDQINGLQLWAMVDTPSLSENPADLSITQRHILVIGTGNPIPLYYEAGRMVFIGSVSQKHGAGAIPFVWHVFEYRPR
jgi:hypothetical protein